MLQYGLHLGQQAEMLTDSLRALYLEACGYETKVFEFISLEHTNKNKMILAVKRRQPMANGELLEKLAGRLGLLTTSVGGLLRVAPGRVRRLRDGGVDLQALLAVTLAAAAEGQEHPLRLLAASFPNWLGFLRELKTMRDAGAHGQSRTAGSKRLKELREGTYRSIELLLPGLKREVVVVPARTRPTMERAHDARRQAISRLEDCFGVRWYAGLDTNMAELLIQVELATASLPSGISGPVNAIRTINNLASVLQALVHARQPVTDHELGHGESSRETAKRRAVKAGLLTEGAELPPGLANVNPRRLHEALQGRSPTLGAGLMALLILAPLEWLHNLAVASRGFLELCTRVLDLRGHGNRPVFMPSEDVLKLKDEVYTACDALMEV